MGLMKTKSRGCAEEAMMTSQEGNGTRRSARTLHISIEIAGAYHIGDLECRFNVPSRAVKGYDTDLWCFGQRDTDLLRECPGKCPGYFEIETSIEHSDRVRTFKFECCRMARH